MIAELIEPTQREFTIANEEPAGPDPAATEWLSRFNTALDVLYTPNDYLAASIPSGTSIEQLLQARRRLRVNDSEFRPAREAARTLGLRFGGGSRTEQFTELFEQVIQGIDTAITHRLARGESHDGLIYSRDFSNIRDLTLRNTAGNELYAYVGMLNSLPTNHRLRTVLGPDETYHYSGRDSSSPCLLLGWAIPTLNGLPGPVRPWFPLSDSLRETRRMANEQRMKWEEQDRQREAEELAERRRFWNSPLGQQEMKNRILKELKDRGRLPDEVIDDPVIRRGII